jgi:hypothetical protein
MSEENAGANFSLDPIEVLSHLDAGVIREKLVRNVQEREALRQLLKLAERSGSVYQSRRPSREA